MARPFSTLLALTTALLLIFAAGAPAHCAGLGEYEVKAAFLYNFSKFVEWPLESSPNGSDPIVITVLGTPANAAAAFESIKGKTVKTRRIEIRNVKRLEEIGQTQIIFVCSSEKEHLGRILDYARNEGILTVSDIEHFEQAGGIISFITVDQKVRFQINLGAARRSGLKISSQLLKLARNVID